MPYNAEPVSTSNAPRSQKNRKSSVRIFLAVWILLICIGVVATFLYSQHMKSSMLQDLDDKWQAQTQAMKADYQSQLTALNKQVQDLASKVDLLNELLTFTKDNASNKTDNSNKLYTQLSEVKKQLSILQQKMDLLK